MNPFKIFTMFDWITPAIGSVSDIRNVGKSEWTFFFPYELNNKMGYNPNQISKLLRKNGIKIRGGQYTWPNDKYQLTVPLAQAQRAAEILYQENIFFDRK